MARQRTAWASLLAEADGAAFERDLRAALERRVARDEGADGRDATA